MWQRDRCPILSIPQRTTALWNDRNLLHKLLHRLVQFGGVAAEEIDMDPVLHRRERLERGNLIRKHHLLGPARDCFSRIEVNCSSASSDGIPESHDTGVIDREQSRCSTDRPLGLLSAIGYYFPSTVDPDQVRGHLNAFPSGNEQHGGSIPPRAAP